MKILDISDKNANSVLEQIHEELKRDIRVVNISYFYCQVDELNHAVISYY